MATCLWRCHHSGGCTMGVAFYAYFPPHTPPDCSVIISGVDGTRQLPSTDPASMLSLPLQQALEEADPPSPFLSRLIHTLFFTPEACLFSGFPSWAHTLKILRCSVVCALSPSPSFTLGVEVCRRDVGWPLNTPGPQHTCFWALLLDRSCS